MYEWSDGKREEPDGCPQADYDTCTTCPHHGRCADDVTED